VSVERLYYNVAAHQELEFQATVTDIRLDSRDGTGQLWQISLDRSAFYPAGGGQPFDIGKLIATSRSGAVLEVPVERVEEDDAGEVWHYVRKPLLEGAKVVGRIDVEHRRDLAQQHSGQHLLSAVFLRELSAPTVSFHLGADKVTVDLAISAPSEDELRRVELAVNREVFADRAIRSRWVAREEAEAMLATHQLRKLPERGGPMRIVEIEGIEHNACGGTHVASTGAIGSILIRRTEKVKQGTRIEFCCGLRAVKAAHRDFELLRQTGALLTVGAQDVPSRVEKLLADSKAAAKELKSLRKAAEQAVQGMHTPER
jgi:alanyl-tRNA synthetase